MLKKNKIAVLTAIATLLSTVSPLATYAENAEPVETIPERAVMQELHTCVDVPTVLDDEMMPVSTTATIPDRVYTCTTVPGIEVQPTEFPLRRTYDVNVNVVDSKTNEHVDGVKVHFVETQDLQSNVITRDYGTWDTSESESYSIDIIHLFTNLSSTITLTAVLEDMPEGYSYLGGATNIHDFIIDNAMDWYYANYYGYEHQPNTDLTIYLDKEYKGTAKASCLLIDGHTGEYVEGAEVSLSEWDRHGNLGNCVEWVTSGKQENIDFDFTVPGDSQSILVQFVADKLPEKYSKYTYCPFVESYVGANSSNLSFVLYVYEEGYDPYNTSPIMPSTNTHTTPPIANITTPPITTTTTTTNTVIACKACDICGTIIDANDGVTTPLGVFVCPSCKSAGAGGTRPPFQTETVTATTTTTTTTIMIDKMCQSCGCLAAAEYGVTTSDGKFICSYCYLHSDDIEYKSCDVCGTIINIDDGINTPIAFVCKECRSHGAGGTRPQFPTDTTTTTTTTATPEVITYGDSNSDGKVNIADSVLIMQCLANPDEFKMNAEQADAADVYNRGDGITTMDALAIQMTSINLISVKDLPVSAE
ncbi:MAG: dockerin type I repeat-containing protein [Prevotella sp.]|nr:dockerin type I repeat-containing protein [Alistipes senegalensis]MCM1357550.1 dockerin type I repeat-containing protein [Prevotella sp.]MCM1473807.1 dockerin type I repeat-containing protein [Muribaculaceae bacterium]